MPLNSAICLEPCSGNTAAIDLISELENLSRSQSVSVDQSATETDRSGMSKGPCRTEIRFEVYASPREIEQAWRAFEDEAIAPWHQTYDYVSRWCEFVAPSHREQPFIVVGYAPDDAIALIWPFAIVTELGVRTLRWLGQGHGGYFFGLYRSDGAHRIDSRTVRNFARWLRHKQPTVAAIVLNYLPNEFDGMECPFSYLSTVRSVPPAFLARLDRCFQEFSKARLSSRARRVIRKKRDEMERSGGVIEVAKTPEDASRLFDVFLRQKELQLSQRRSQNPFKEPAIVAFYRSLLAGGDATHGIQVASIRLGSEHAATCSVAVMHERVYVLQLSMQGGLLDRVSPGLLLLEEMMMRNFANRGGIMDFGPGVGSHKAFWKCEDMPRFAAYQVMRAWGWPIVGGHLARAWLKGMAKKLVARRQLKTGSQQDGTRREKEAADS